MKTLFLHGWHSVPGGVKPTFLADHGHEFLNPALDDDDFEAAVWTAQAEYDQHKPDVIVGSSRGGAVAMIIESGETPFVLLCPAWKNWGTAKTVKANSTILHSKADDTVPFADSEELVRNSGLPESALIEIGNDHRLADPEPLKAMLEACDTACLPQWNDSELEVLEQNWNGQCYLAVIRWLTVASAPDWTVLHGTVISEKVGMRIDHAWCERGNTVIDFTMPVGSRIIGRARYYLAAEPSNIKAYASDEAVILSLKTRHHGPWD